MRNLLNFLIKYNTWFVFAFYVLLSCVLLFRNNVYQQSVYLTSANIVSSGVGGVVSDIGSYFNLKEVNSELTLRNAELEKQLLNLNSEIAGLRTLIPDSSEALLQSTVTRYNYVMAGVVNNSTSRHRNYFTINKGLQDGIKPGMGVVDHNGIVGIVNVVGQHTARVISVLSEPQHFSVRIKNANSVGSLVWRQGNPRIAYAEEMPRHEQYHTGDTIVTSGFSTTFPAGIPVGVVMSRMRSKDDNFITLKVRLFSNFEKLGTVRVIKDVYKQELDSLQNFDAIE